MHGSWGKCTVESISRQKLNWKLIPSLLCVVVLAVEVCCASLPEAGEPLPSQLSHLDSGNLGFGLEFLLAGIQGDIHVDNLTCSLDLRVFWKIHLSHTPLTHIHNVSVSFHLDASAWNLQKSCSWGFWQVKKVKDWVTSPSNWYPLILWVQQDLSVCFRGNNGFILKQFAFSIYGITGDK